MILLVKSEGVDFPLMLFDPLIFILPLRRFVTIWHERRTPFVRSTGSFWDVLYRANTEAASPQTSLWQTIPSSRPLPLRRSARPPRHSLLSLPCFMTEVDITVNCFNVRCWGGLKHRHKHEVTKKNALSLRSLPLTEALICLRLILEENKTEEWITCWLFLTLTKT